MADTNQRLYVNGFKKSANNHTAANRYTDATISLMGADQKVHELIFYNFDMMGQDLRDSAEIIQGYFKNVIPGQTCYYTCGSCDKLNYLQCESCVGVNRTQVTPGCACNDGYFETTESADCV